jgi:hypothetical protein
MTSNAETLTGLIGKTDEWTLRIDGTLIDGDGGEWTATELTAAIKEVEDAVATLKRLAKFAGLASQCEAE